MVVGPYCRPWWTTIDDSGDERQSQRFPPSAAWFSAPESQTKRASLRSHPWVILFSWKTRIHRETHFRCNNVENNQKLKSTPFTVSNLWGLGFHCDFIIKALLDYDSEIEITLSKLNSHIKLKLTSSLFNRHQWCKIFQCKNKIINTCKCYSVSIWTTWKSWTELQFLQINQNPDRYVTARKKHIIFCCNNFAFNVTKISHFFLLWVSEALPLHRRSELHCDTGNISICGTNVWHLTWPDTCLTLVFKNVVSQTAEARTDVVSLLHRCRVSHPAIQEILSHNSCQAKRLQVNLPADYATGSRNDICYGNQI